MEAVKIEILFELIFDILFEGSDALASDKFVPPALRAAAIIVFSLFALAAVVLMAAAAVMLFAAGYWYFAVPVGALGAVLAFFAVKRAIYYIRK